MTNNITKTYKISDKNLINQTNSEFIIYNTLKKVKKKIYKSLQLQMRLCTVNDHNKHPYYCHSLLAMSVEV